MVTATIQRARKEGIISFDTHNGEEVRRGNNIRAALALFSEEMVSGAEEISQPLPPHGLGKLNYDYEQKKHVLSPIVSLKGRRPFEIVQVGTNAVLESATSTIIKKYYQNPEELEQENYPLFTAVRELELFSPSDPTRLITNGIHTAQGTMTNVLEVIPKVLTKECHSVSYERLMDIAHKNFSFINTLTSVDKPYISGLVRLLQDSDTAVGRYPFNPTYLTMRDGEVLDFTDDFSQKALERLGEVPEDAYGCPARYTTAIKKLWKRNLQLAGRIWIGETS